MRRRVATALCRLAGSLALENAPQIGAIEPPLVSEADLFQILLK
jgi:hypothetical protein